MPGWWSRRRAQAAAALRPRWPHLGVGAGLFALLALGAAVYAAAAHRPVGPEIVTWCEWFVAATVLPALILPGLARRAEIAHWARRRLGLEQAETDAAYEYRQRQALLRFCALLWVWAGTVFGLDLLLRALAGLGFDPF